MMNYLPSKLTKLRKHYNYSQQYVAEKLGIDVVDYMDYENGNNMVNYHDMKKLASLYHVTVNDIFLNNDQIVLPEVKEDTNEINTKYFIPENNFSNKIKGFVLNHKVATVIIGILLLAIITLSVALNSISKPYEIHRENINRLSVSETTVIYIDDSGAIGFSGSNENGQLNDLAVTSAIKVCEGAGFSVVLNEDGSVVCSGLISKYNKVIKDWENIIDIAAGNNHIVALDSNGRVYCAGETEACGIEGNRNIKKVFATENASIVLNDVGKLSYAGSFIGASYLQDFLNIKDIASSDNILAILNNDSTLNVYSKTGTYLKSETWTDIVDVACGNDFVAGLNEYGKVFIEIENYEIQEKVNEWSNIIAIAAGKDYLIGFDGKKIYGVGNNYYNQFVKEEKQKMTLDKVKNIEYSIEKENIYIQFAGVNNANGYIINIDVGTGLSKHIENTEMVEFSNENMIEGKTYTISVISLGTGDYKDSDPAEINFVYEKPEEKIDVEVSLYIGKSKEELEKYLSHLDIGYEASVAKDTLCENDKGCVIEIYGIEDGKYTRAELDAKLVEYTYCDLGEEGNEQESVED